MPLYRKQVNFCFSQMALTATVEPLLSSQLQQYRMIGSNSPLPSPPLPNPHLWMGWQASPVQGYFFSLKISLYFLHTVLHTVLMVLTGEFTKYQSRSSTLGDHVLSSHCIDF